jgi:peptidoglycan/LPS O-acetylase OafA/YrhL
MQTFRVTFSRNPVVVLLLIVVPLLVAAAFVVPLLIIPNLPDWAVLFGSFLMMGAAILVMLFVMKKWGTVKADVVMNEEGISVKLVRFSPFYPVRSYQCSWDGLHNVSTNYDPRHNKRFYLLSFKSPRTTINLQPEEATDRDNETGFGIILLGYVSRYNESHTAQPETQIKSRGFYDTWWAKALTLLAYAMSAVVLIMFSTDRERMPWWRAVQVTTISTLWLAAYYANRKYHKSFEKN